MSTKEAEIQRLAAKTPQQRFVQELEQGLYLAPKIADLILQEAQTHLYGPQGALRPGQMRVILARQGARGGQALAETPSIEVIWTIDAGQEDRVVLQQHGSQALRRVRLQRLLEEAVEQGGVASQEDLAHALQVSVRTIKRDFAELQGQGLVLPSRGNLQGIGRGQTHKGQILHYWLGGETYDQLAQRTHHSASAIQRYVRAFLQVVILHAQGFSDEQMALLLQIGVPLVKEYQAVYAQHDTPAYRQRLADQTQRFQHASQAKKGAR
jgi:hypothetical protein